MGVMNALCVCFQGNSTKEYFLQRTLQSLERYFYLIAFNYYLHEQVKTASPGWVVVGGQDDVSSCDGRRMASPLIFRSMWRGGGVSPG